MVGVGCMMAKNVLDINLDSVAVSLFSAVRFQHEYN